MKTAVDFKSGLCASNLSFSCKKVINQVMGRRSHLGKTNDI